MLKNIKMIYLGADHRGFELKALLMRHLDQTKWKYVDMGDKEFDENDDYPDYATYVCEKIQENPEEFRGILICGTGQGMVITANKFPSVRAALCDNAAVAHDSVAHNATNVMCLPADILDEAKMKEIVDTFLGSEFTGIERHLRRLHKIKLIEERFQKAPVKEEVGLPKKKEGGLLRFLK
jgi:ribose 5-phosphate isomerase B